MSEGQNARIAIICGSPREGFCAQLLEYVQQGIEHAGAHYETFYLSRHHVKGCDGCEVCSDTGVCVKTGDVDDDFALLEEMLDAADGLIVATPVYFAGAPSQLKAVYDRFQTRWAKRYVLGQPAPAKRPATLIVAGTGKDPFGYEPLVTSTRSALNIAGFSLGETHDFVGEDIDDPGVASRARKLGNVLAYEWAPKGNGAGE